VPFRWALSNLIVKPDPKVAQLATQHSSEIELPPLWEKIAQAAYSDFAQLPIGKDKDASRLAGVADLEVRILGGQESHSVKDEIEAVLALATANLELELMAASKSRDSATSTPIGHALRARQIRVGRPHEAFGSLRELVGIPDVAEAVLQKQLGLDVLIKLRESSSGRSFRGWFHENCAGDPGNTAKAYIDLLAQVPKIQSMPAKVVRFLITTALGLIPGLGPIIGAAIGAAASAADSFAVDSLAQRRSPKFFVQQLKQLEDEIAK